MDKASGPVACEVCRSDRADVELHFPSMGSQVILFLIPNEIGPLCPQLEIRACAVLRA